MTLTEWMPCTTAPVRDGWYDLERRLSDGSAIYPSERVRFANGKWDVDACESKVSVWTSMDYWRGVTKPEGESANHTIDLNLEMENLRRRSNALCPGIPISVVTEESK